MQVEEPVDLLCAGRDTMIAANHVSQLERYAAFGGGAPRSPPSCTKGAEASLFGGLVEFQFSEGESLALAREFHSVADEELTRPQLATLLLERMLRHHNDHTRHTSHGSTAFASLGQEHMDLRGFVRWNEELSGRVQRRAIAERAMVFTRVDRAASLKRRSMEIAPCASRFQPATRRDSRSLSMELPDGAPRSPSAWMASKLGASASMDELEEGEALVAAKRQRRRSIVGMKKQQPVSPNSASASSELLKALYKGSPVVGPTVRRGSLMSNGPGNSRQGCTSPAAAGTAARTPCAVPTARRGSLFNPIKWRNEPTEGAEGGDKRDRGGSPWGAHVAMMKQRRRSFGDVLANAMPAALREQHELLSRFSATPANDKASLLVAMLRDKMLLD